MWSCAGHMTSKYHFTKIRTYVSLCVAFLKEQNTPGFHLKVHCVDREKQQILEMRCEQKKGRYERRAEP